MKNNINHIQTMLDELSTWMEKNGHQNIESFRGKMSQALTPDAKLFTRTQYIEALGGKR